jgi:NCAIR mutase (PurE)-related protein
MNLDTWLDDFAAGRLDRDELKKRLLQETFVDIGLARLDTHRPVRTGLPEAVYCESKSPEQVAAIFASLAEAGHAVLGTRARAEHHAAVAEHLADVHYDPLSRILSHGVGTPSQTGKVLVISAGTSDAPIMEEAAQTAEFLGSRVVRHPDCGAAGVHRLLACLPDFSDAAAIIAVAGMDGVLPTVTSGLAGCPVIALPTSVGYGAGLGGYAALLTMLNSCAPGLSVVNIDNGFGAGYLAHMINMQTRQNAARKPDDSPE